MFLAILVTTSMRRWEMVGRWRCASSDYECVVSFISLFFAWHQPQGWERLGGVDVTGQRAVNGLVTPALPDGNHTRHAARNLHHLFGNLALGDWLGFGGELLPAHLYLNVRIDQRIAVPVRFSAPASSNDITASFFVESKFHRCVTGLAGFASCRCQQENVRADEFRPGQVCKTGWGF